MGTIKKGPIKSTSTIKSTKMTATVILKTPSLDEDIPRCDHLASERREGRSGWLRGD